MANMIFDTTPGKWEELEEMVNQAFLEMGYESKQNHEVKTVRGRVRIDVYAIKKSSPVPTVILCECKHWSKPVEQNVILGFRTICSDIGAHYGLIISRAGFQSGANDSRDATNIHLLSFSDFQQTFFKEWKLGIFMKFAQMCDTMIKLLPGHPDCSEIQGKLRNINVFDKYSMFFGGERRYTNYFIEDSEFPIQITDPRDDPTVSKKITIPSHRQYFEIGKEACADARAHFGI